jgi:hypothetical protein
MDSPIFHGPALEETKPPLGRKYRPTTWSTSVRLPAKMLDDVEALARKYDVGRGDIVRSAIVAFLAKHTPTTADHPQTLSDTQNPPVISQPKTFPTFRGNGTSDHKAHMAAQDRNNLRRAIGQTGERVTDKSTLR